MEYRVKQPWMTLEGKQLIEERRHIIEQQGAGEAIKELTKEIRRKLRNLDQARQSPENCSFTDFWFIYIYKELTGQLKIKLK